MAIAISLVCIVILCWMLDKKWDRHKARVIEQKVQQREVQRNMRAEAEYEDHAKPFKPGQNHRIPQFHPAETQADFNPIWTPPEQVTEPRQDRNAPHLTEFIEADPEQHFETAKAEQADIERQANAEKAMGALQTLGYKKTDAKSAIQLILDTDAADTVQDMLKAALILLAK